MSSCAGLVELVELSDLAGCALQDLQDGVLVLGGGRFVGEKGLAQLAEGLHDGRVAQLATLLGCTVWAEETTRSATAARTVVAGTGTARGEGGIGRLGVGGEEALPLRGVCGQQRAAGLRDGGELAAGFLGDGDEFFVLKHAQRGVDCAGTRRPVAIRALADGIHELVAVHGFFAQEQKDGGAEIAAASAPTATKSAAAAKARAEAGVGARPRPVARTAAMAGTMPVTGTVLAVRAAPGEAVKMRPGVILGTGEGEVIVHDASLLSDGGGAMLNPIDEDSDISQYIASASNYIDKCRNGR